MNKNTIKIIECPRDAMQGIVNFIPTKEKADYINALLEVGFDSIDFGSFVSPKAIPQMADTSDLMKLLHLDKRKSKLLSIVANYRGAEMACAFDEIDQLGFPFSISETFQQRNANSSIEEAMERVEEIQNLCVQKNKELVIYISMGFGNPYGDKYNYSIVNEWIEKLSKYTIGVFSLSDTIGVSNPDSILELFQNAHLQFPNLEIGMHLHSTPKATQEKLEAMLLADCKRIDTAMLGFGGCPFAKDELTGNIATEKLLHFFESKSIETNLNMHAFAKAQTHATSLFSQYH